MGESLVTIILSLVTADYALQVSDRLLTLKSGSRYEPWDPVANKSVVMLTRDGLVTMAYSGPAHIARATTDGWIAQSLSGEVLGADRERPDFGLEIGGARPDLPLAVNLAAIADRLNEAFNTGNVTDELTIDYVGFRWQKPEFAWPTMGRIVWDRQRGGYRMVMARKRGGWECGRDFMFRASGRSEKQAQGLLRSRLPSVVVSKEHAAAELVDILRSLPPHDPTVGRDCLVTTIQRSSPHVHIRYEPYDIRQVSVVFTSQTVTLPASYTPWIITPGLLAAPQVISGQGITHQSDGFNFVVEVPELGEGLTIMSSQPRRLWPPP